MHVLAKSFISFTFCLYSGVTFASPPPPPPTISNSPTPLIRECLLVWINLYEGNLVDREKWDKSDSYSSVQFLQLMLVLPPSLPPSPSVHCAVTACVKWQHVFHDRMTVSFQK